MNEVDLDGAQKCLEKARPIIEDILWAMPRMIEKLRAYEDSYWKLEKEVKALREVAEAAKELYRVSCSNEERTMQPWDELSKALKNLDELNRR